MPENSVQGPGFELQVPTDEEWVEWLPEDLQSAFVMPKPGGPLYFDVHGLPAAFRQYAPCSLTYLIERALRIPDKLYPLLLRIVAPRLGPVMARGLEIPSVRGICWIWLRRYPYQAAVGLIPAALGPDDAESAWAAGLLSRLIRLGNGWPQAIESASLFYGPELQAALTLRLALVRDPEAHPDLPDFVDPERLVAPVYTDSARPLPAEQLTHLVRLLAADNWLLPGAAVTQFKAVCRPESLAAFALSLTQLWLDQGAPREHEWMFGALAVFGDAAGIRWLEPLLASWPGERAHDRALSGLDLLLRMADIPDSQPLALNLLGRLAETSRQPAFRAAARLRLEALAQLIGLSPDALADRFVPDYGLDAEGTRPWLLGERLLFVSIIVRTGKPDRRFAVRLVDKPAKPASSLLKAASPAEAQAWKAYQRALETSLSEQARRLETAMCQGRRWSVTEFRAVILAHPLLSLLARRLLWALWLPGADPLSPMPLNLASDFELPPDAELAVMHPLQLGPERETWQQHYAGLVQPFEQLEREVMLPEDPERQRHLADWCRRMEVPMQGIKALRARGWLPENHGFLSRRFAACCVWLGIDYRDWRGSQEWAGISLAAYPLSGPLAPVPLGELEPVAASELFRELNWLFQFRQNSL